MKVTRAALTTIVGLALSGVSVAQQTPEVIVEAPHVEMTTQAGAMGRKMPAMSISYRVSYGDLNLATHSGAVELEKRIKESATRACEQLRKLYPDTTEGNPPCVEGAVKAAMANANKAIAAAEKAAK
jgi:UrcA family protein